MTQKEHDENLLVVTAVEGYSYRHNIPATEAFDLLDRQGVLALVRKNYETLHTQSLEETADFADDIMSRKAS
jgi:hypothetical protein